MPRRCDNEGAGDLDPRPLPVPLPCGTRYFLAVNTIFPLM